MVICLERGADLRMAQLMPLPLTVSCFSKIQTGFTFLVPAHPGSPGQRAVKRVCVCVCFPGGLLTPFVPMCGRPCFLRSFVPNGQTESQLCCQQNSSTVELVDDGERASWPGARITRRSTVIRLYNSITSICCGFLNIELFPCSIGQDFD